MKGRDGSWSWGYMWCDATGKTTTTTTKAEKARHNRNIYKRHTSWKKKEKGNPKSDLR